MKTTAIAVSLPPVRSWLCLPESLADYVSLMQPRLMLLGVFTAVVGLAIAPDHPDLLRASLAILAFAIFFYVVVYTICLKRRTPQNIVIGAAGALPPVIGWAAATGLSDNMTMPAELMNCVCSPERMAISGGVKCFTVSRL